MDASGIVAELRSKPFRVSSFEFTLLRKVFRLRDSLYVTK